MTMETFSAKLDALLAEAFDTSLPSSEWERLQSACLSAAFGFSGLVVHTIDFQPDSYFVLLLREIMDKIAMYDTAVLEAERICIEVTAPGWVVGEPDKPAVVKLTVTFG